MPIDMDAQRPIVRAEMWALYRARVRISGPEGVHTDSLGVLEALRERMFV